MKKNIQEHFYDFISTLEKKDARFLIAFSGGSDSLVLTDLFYKSKLNFSIAHCNFKLRGEESDADAEFAKTIAQKLNVECFVKEFDLSNSELGSIQESARKARYYWFAEIVEEGVYDYIVTAHHSDDNIETFFMHMIRGAGLRGLSGIPSKRNNIIRPLLKANKNEIYTYAKEHELPFREDSSNKENKYRRNQLRNEILPLFDSSFPGWRERMLQNISQLGETEKLVQHLIEEQKTKYINRSGRQVNLNIVNFLSDNVQPKISLYYALREFGFRYDVCAQLSEQFQYDRSKLAGKIFQSSTHTAVCSGEELIVRSQDTIISTKETYMVNLENTVFVIPGSIVEIRRRDGRPDKRTLLGLDLNEAVISADNLQQPLYFRKWRDGDQFRPLGMKGFKKISDFFIDEKLNRFEKNEVWLFCSGEDIVWVAGMRIDDRYKVEETTEHTLELSIRSLS